jgi:hypothetical protein
MNMCLLPQHCSGCSGRGPSVLPARCIPSEQMCAILGSSGHDRKILICLNCEVSSAQPEIHDEVVSFLEVCLHTHVKYTCVPVSSTVRLHDAANAIGSASIRISRSACCKAQCLHDHVLVTCGSPVHMCRSRMVIALSLRQTLVKHMA